MKLNTNLIIKQDLNRKDIALIKKLHKKKNKLFKMSKYYLKKHDLVKARNTGKILTEIEFKMQDAWKFDRNINMHSHWMFNPSCSCPILDNLDEIGNKFKHTDMNCIIHGVCAS